MDHRFTDWAPNSDGLARVLLSSAAARRSVTVWLDTRYSHVTIFTGDTVEPRSRITRALGVETMICPPNGLATREDVM